MAAFVPGLELSREFYAGASGRFAVLSIAETWPIGTVDQFGDLLWPAEGRRILLRLFDEG